MTEPSADGLLLAHLSTGLSNMPLLLSHLAFYFEQRHIYIRQAIKLLSSICHSIRISKTLGYTDTSWDQFSQDIQELRAKWFQMGKVARRERLLCLTATGLEIYKQILDGLNMFMLKSGFSEVLDLCHSDILFEISQNRVILFSDVQWKTSLIPVTKPCLFPRILNKPGRRMFGPTGCSIIVLPKVMAAYYYIHAGFNTALGRHLRTRFLSPSNLPVPCETTPFFAAMQEQSRTYDAYRQFVLKQRLGAKASINLFHADENPRPFKNILHFVTRPFRQAIHRAARDMISSGLPTTDAG